MGERGGPASGSGGSQSSPWNTFLWSLGLLLVLVTSTFFAGAAGVSEQALGAELVARGHALFDAVLMTREWNERHGGVLVEKRPGVELGSYPGAHEVVADGRTWVPRAHAEMVREISDIALEHGEFKFRITSLAPVNLHNRPDEFEREALLRFNQGESHAVTREQREGVTWFRYAAPLRVEPSCVGCHPGEKVGGIRGAMSVSFPVAEAEGAVARVRWIMAGLWILTVAVLLAAAWGLAVMLRRRIEQADARVRELASTDEVTGLRNRRFVLERLSDEVGRSHRYLRPLSCILFDVDHFKQVNDTLGHEAGDRVLAAVAAAVQQGCRSSDVVARHGGDEFLVLLPETGPEAAAALAERLRLAVEALPVEYRQRKLAVTCSFGVSSLSGQGEPQPEEADHLLRRADDALYAAKRQGRNSVAQA